MAVTLLNSLSMSCGSIDRRRVSSDARAERLKGRNAKVEVEVGVNGVAESQ